MAELQHRHTDCICFGPFYQLRNVADSTAQPANTVFDHFLHLPRNSTVLDVLRSGLGKSNRKSIQPIRAKITSNYARRMQRNLCDFTDELLATRNWMLPWLELDKRTRSRKRRNHFHGVISVRPPILIKSLGIL